MLKADNNTFSIREDEYEELKTHRMLFIHDILLPEISILLNADHQIFQIGNPKFNFQYIRILGLVTDINNDTLWIGNYFNLKYHNITYFLINYFKKT